MSSINYTYNISNFVVEVKKFLEKCWVKGPCECLRGTGSDKQVFEIVRNIEAGKIKEYSL